ncbi:MAG: methyltransferase domain-containing protein [Acidimicrobiales bacterium]|jgi:SAM-dependent methyltransferase
MTSAAELLERWRSDLELWAIPDEIIAAAPESPWVLPRRIFIRRAEIHCEAPPSSPSYRRAWEALEKPGSVLDVGAGAGAACLPLVARATEVCAVDSDQELLNVLVDSANRLGKPAFPICGRWPDIAGEVAPADVVTCHHVLYNVPDLGPFVAALMSHARRRVVVEMTARHPLTALNPLWERFHGLARPEVPTVDDALAVLEALGLAPRHETWCRSGGSDHESFEDLVEVTTRRLCLGPGRIGEIASALRELGAEGERSAEPGSPGVDLVTIWWDGPV